MKFEIEIKKSRYSLDTFNDKTVWIADIIHPDDDNNIFNGEGDTAGEAFEQAMLKLCFQLIEGDQ